MENKDQKKNADEVFEKNKIPGWLSVKGNVPHSRLTEKSFRSFSAIGELPILM